MLGTRNIARSRRSTTSVNASRIFRYVASATAIVVSAFFLMTLRHLSELEAHLTRGDAGIAGPTAKGVQRSDGVGKNVEMDHDEDELADVDWNLPLVHTLTTRFMQDQSHLLDLAKARLHLFERFCLPTVLGQSIFAPYTPPDEVSSTGVGGNVTSDEGMNVVADPRFLWIVKTDPDLPREILSQLVALLSPHPQFYVVGSNVNFGVGIKAGGWRGGQAGRDLLVAHREGRLHCGDMTLLRRAHAARDERIVLETRLDADDGLNFLYMERIQTDSLKYLTLGWENEGEDEEGQAKDATNRTGVARTSGRKMTNYGGSQEDESADWMYWCVFSHVAWEPSLGLPIPRTNSTQMEGNNSSVDTYGLFIPWKTPMACVTAGLTTGASVGLSEHGIPRFAHDKIVLSFRGPNATSATRCGLPKGADCLKMVESPKVAALRSRTPTSAGMKDVSGKLNKAERIMEQKSRDPKMQKSMWAVLGRYFGITPTVAKEANDYVREHLVEIAEDNLRGQCTKGHSCKPAAREELARMIDLAKTVREERQKKGKIGAG